MVRALLCTAALAMAACGAARGGDDANVLEPCGAHAAPEVVVTQQSEEPLGDGDTVIFGDGLQAGGSFVAFTMFVRGLQLDVDYTIDMGATHGGNEEWAREVYVRGLGCTISDAFEGYLGTPALHLRFADRLQPELEGQTVEFTVSVSDPSSNEATHSFAAVLQHWE